MKGANNFAPDDSDADDDWYGPYSWDEQFEKSTVLHIEGKN